MQVDAEMVQAATNPALGVAIFILAGLAGAVFYLPFKKVQNWAWESYWFVYALFGLVIAPWIAVWITSPNVITVLRRALAESPGVVGFCFLCGAMWGIGGLTWGLMIRYLGVGLGLALGCGLCSATGTLIPPTIKGEFASLVKDSAGVTSLGGVLVSLLGIIFVGGAGMSKESEVSEEIKKATVAEYNFKLGVIVAIFSGVMSAAMNFGLQGGTAIEKLALTVEPVTSTTWKGFPLLVVVLFGGFVVNGGWCLFLNLKNRTANDYVKADAPLSINWFFAGLAGVLWYMQFVCLKSGGPKMGQFEYIGWSVMFSSMILFSTVFGIVIGEWRNTSTRTRSLLLIGLLLLVASSMISAFAGYLKPPA